MIDIRDVSKTYTRGETRVDALRGVSCQIDAGSMTLIVGPSGSGKSSLLYLVGALDQPSAGEITVAGLNLQRLSRGERDNYRRDKVGYIFQNFNLLSNLTALENVLVPYLPRGISSARRKEAGELLERLGLAARADHRPNQLSGGEQQRVAIARALFKKPLLVLGDEPTGELDSQTGAEIYRLLRDLQTTQGSTILVVTHDRGHLRAGDHVLTIRDGRLADRRVHEEAVAEVAV